VQVQQPEPEQSATPTRFSVFARRLVSRHLQKAPELPSTAARYAAITRQTIFTFSPKFKFQNQNQQQQRQQQKTWTCSQVIGLFSPTLVRFPMGNLLERPSGEQL